MTILRSANGNLASTSGAVVRTHVWSSFDLPLSMGMSGRSMAWVYGTDRQRVQNTITDGSVTRTIHYLHPDRSGGLFYERESSGSTIENRHFISAGGGVIGVVKTFGSNNATVAANPDHVNYWHKDHLGSLVAVSNANGAVLERMAYDAWGKRLFPNGTTDPNGQINPASTDRGYTGHEHLDELGFVHMNGRIYDPLLGRFLSPDPHIQDEALLQNYNRYSYVLNNPLRYTDPTGEWIQVLQAFALVIGAALADSNNKDLKIIGTLMMMAAMNGVVAEGGLLQAAAAGEAMISAVASFASAAIANTIAYGPEAGIKAGLFAAAFTGAGGIPGALSPERIIAHALLGCLQQATSGGKCGPGAAAAAFGKVATGVAEIAGLTDFGSQFAVTTIVGGTASVIGGGKFANGAAQAAFGYLFNFCSRPGNCGWGAVRELGEHAWSRALSSLGFAPTAQVGIGHSTHGMFGVFGAGMDDSLSMDSKGAVQPVCSRCFIVGLGVGASTGPAGSAGSGALTPGSTSLTVNLFAEGTEALGIRGQAGLRFSSLVTLSTDPAVQIQAGPRVGSFVGGGVKVCAQKVGAHACYGP